MSETDCRGDLLEAVALTEFSVHYEDFDVNDFYINLLFLLEKAHIEKILSFNRHPNHPSQRFRI